MIENQHLAPKLFGSVFFNGGTSLLNKFMDREGRAFLVSKHDQQMLLKDIEGFYKQQFKTF